MKFMAKTSMDTATMRDVVLAHRQGTLVELVPVNGLESARGNSRMARIGLGFGNALTVFYMIVSLLFLMYGILLFRKARKDANFAPNWSMKQPLVFT